MNRKLTLFTLPFFLVWSPFIQASAEANVSEEDADVAPSAADIHFSEAELEQMLAPIALYPDVLLAQILIAATYPLEIVQAHRWLRTQPDLEGEDAVSAAMEEDWDPSVAALTAFPTVLERMDADLAWTQRLGDAFLLQEPDVMDTIQSLRNKAIASGHLQSTDKQIIEREKETIIIEPADPEIVYVPYYSTRVVYSDWHWPYHPPVYWGPPTGYFYPTVGFSWGRGSRISVSFFASTFYWPRREVIIVNHTRPNYPGPRWRPHPGVTYPRWVHDPRHRRGVVYPKHALVRHHARLSGGAPRWTPPPPPHAQTPPRAGRPGRVAAPGSSEAYQRPRPPRDWHREPERARAISRAERTDTIRRSPDMVRERLRDRPGAPPGYRPERPAEFRNQPPRSVNRSQERVDRIHQRHLTRTIRNGTQRPEHVRPEASPQSSPRITAPPATRPPQAETSRPPRATPPSAPPRFQPPPAPSTRPPSARPGSAPRATPPPPSAGRGAMVPRSPDRSRSAPTPARPRDVQRPPR